MMKFNRVVFVFVYFEILVLVSSRGGIANFSHPLPAKMLSERLENVAEAWQSRGLEEKRKLDPYFYECWNQIYLKMDTTPLIVEIIVVFDNHSMEIFFYTYLCFNNEEYMAGLEELDEYSNILALGVERFLLRQCPHP